jgi:YD repeat-containing protein
LLGLTAGLVLAAPAAAADRGITFTFPAYSPPDITIKTGDTATFSGDFGDHPLVWDGSQFGETNTGSSKAFSFSQPGTYSYHCRLHQSQGMVGVVRVVADQHPARVAFAVSPTPPTAGQPVTFTYTGDQDPDGALTRWDWDLDGNGSFETSTAGPAASTRYPAAATLTVRMRAIDDSNEASAVAEQAVSIAPAGAAAPGSATSSADRTAPRLTRVSIKGLTLTFRATEPAAASAVLRVRGKTVAKGTAKVGRTTVHLRLTARGRKLLRRGHRVKATLQLTLRDASANARTVKRKVIVRRR